MKAAIFLADGFEETEAVTIIDILRRAGTGLTVVSINSDKKVTSAHNLIVEADTAIDDWQAAAETDMLILPGGMPGMENLSACSVLNEIIIKHHQSGKYLAAICAAPTVFSRLGLLKDKKVTAYPSFQEGLDAGTVISNQKTVIDDKIITSQGVGTAIDFSLQLAAIFAGEAAAADIRAKILYE